MKLILVVPDGILNHKNTKPTISNTYKAALDLAIKEASEISSRIVLLPANSFGTEKEEQDYEPQYRIVYEQHVIRMHVFVRNEEKIFKKFVQMR